MLARAVHEHDDEEIREFLGYMSEEQAHHLGIGRWQDQGGQAPPLRTHREKHIANRPHDLAGHGGPDRLGCPTPPGIIDPSKAPFILGHDHNRARVPSVSLLEESLDLRGEAFLNASCSAALACGWRGRGTTLRHRWRLRTRYTVVLATCWPTTVSNAALIWSPVLTWPTSLCFRNCSTTS